MTKRLTKEEQSMINARHEAFRGMYKVIHDRSLSLQERKDECERICLWHSMVWADLEVYPKEHPLRMEREALLERMPDVLRRAAATEGERRSGQVSLL